MKSKTQRKNEKQAAKKSADKTVAVNKKAAFDYYFVETLEVGIALEGSEVKSVKRGDVSLRESFCHIDNGNLELKNCQITPYAKVGAFAPDPRRNRRLLLHKTQLKRLAGKAAEKGFTIVPVKMYFKGRFVKLEIALARGKKNYEKKQVIKDRDVKRTAEREIVNYR
ncbi:MAG: SsrA-binding protein SmpB [Clostridia bacterium]|jgi:SsrA-binding protein|nr:SsrA-binding protein SmpB [Clostridia bacterium]MCI9459524.1 SsrA-binding protein SmpB [Clostridia bacterium]